MIPEKYKNTCPLDHSTYEKYIECNCNFGSVNEVWYFKEQELAKLKEENEKLKALVDDLILDCERCDRYFESSNSRKQFQRRLTSKKKEALGE